VMDIEPAQSNENGLPLGLAEPEINPFNAPIN